jgi:ubiquitin C-terminal hydrolase
MAINNSIQQEPLDLDQRQRVESELPVGLKNVGNTCYFNSLLQAIFMLPNISQKVIQANP